MTAPVDMDPLKILKALADQSRLEILSIIASEPGWTNTGLTEKHSRKLSQPTMSHHLEILRKAGLIQGWEDGRYIRYKLVPSTLRHIADHLRKLR